MRLSDRITVMSRAIMPPMANQRGVLFGGKLMEWMDEVSGIAAKRFAHSEVTTVAVEQVRFLAPIPVGAFVEVRGKVIGTGNTSLRVRVSVFMDGEQAGGIDKEAEMLTAEAFFVYVALDEEGKPKKVEQKL